MELNAIDLFSGIGGMTLGFSKQGYNIIVANEINKPTAAIYKANYTNVRMIIGDIRKEKKEIIEIGKKENIHVVFGGFPCQSYSMSGNRNPTDPRGYLYKEFLNVVDKVQPEIFVGENVKGILSFKQPKRGISQNQLDRLEKISSNIEKLIKLARRRSQTKLSTIEENLYLKLLSRKKMMFSELNSYLESIIEKIKSETKKIGYNVQFKVLNAADYGVPQNRERLIIIGSKKDIGNEIYPEPSHASLEMIQNNASLDGNINLKPHITVEEAIEDLKVMDEDKSFYHVFAKHKPSFIDKMHNTKQGESVHRYKEAFFRLFPDKPSPTVKGNHGSVFLHYDLDRVLTPRELARLQSFPDNFKLFGAKSVILKAIGDSVPPLLSESIASNIKKVRKY